MKKIYFLFLIVHCTLVIDNCLCQWVQVSSGIGIVTVSALAANTNSIYAGAGTNSLGVFKSTNNGDNWVSSLSNQYVNSLAVNGNNVFAGVLNNVYQSTDNGTNWNVSLSNQSPYSLAINGNTIFAGLANTGVYKSTNNGANWSSASLSGFCLSLATNGDTIFAGRYFMSLIGVFRSTNNGANWTQTLNNEYVRSLAVNGNNVYAGTSNPINGIYKSTDYGTSWAQTSLNNQYVWSIAVNGNNVFAGTMSAGVYVSANNGTDWIQRNEGLGNDTVYSLCVFNNYIFAGTKRGVYRRPIGELTGVHPVSNEVPEEYKLFQNYPNPFNPSTKIRFAIPLLRGVVAEGGRGVLLVIYDILGREVSTLVNQQLKPGSYEVTFDAGNFSSGIYFYRLETEGFNDVKKMMLVK